MRAFILHNYNPDEKRIDTMHHHEYLEYCQRVSHLFFTLQQDLLSMAPKMKIFSIISLQAARRCLSAVAQYNIAGKALVYHQTIRN